MALYQQTDPGRARQQVTELVAALRSCPIAELARLGGTLHAWLPELIAHFDHPTVSNGPTENLNLKIKNTKRIARGYRNFDHYRLRLLLNHGRIREDHSPTRIRTRAPSSLRRAGYSQARVCSPWRAEGDGRSARMLLAACRLRTRGATETVSPRPHSQRYGSALPGEVSHAGAASRQEWGHPV